MPPAAIAISRIRPVGPPASGQAAVALAAATANIKQAQNAICSQSIRLL